MDITHPAAVFISLSGKRADGRATVMNRGGGLETCSSLRDHSDKWDKDVYLPLLLWLHTCFN